MADNAQKTPLVRSLNKFTEDTFDRLQQMRGKGLPASIEDIDDTGTIVTVKFEVQSDIFTLPTVKCALATNEFERPPVAKGTKGYVVPSELYMGAMTGLGDGVATFDRQSNLSNLVFHPVGNKNFGAVYDPLKYVLLGPDGVILRTVSGSVIVNIGPVDDGPKNVMQLLDLVNAANDVAAAGAGVPLLGLYHSNGAVRIRIS